MYARPALRGARAVLFVPLLLACLIAYSADAADTSLFEKLAGRWVGEGRLGISGGNTENVKCRATYILADEGSQLKQSIRCASASGNIEVQSTVMQSSSTLTGSWKELIRDMSGQLSGTATANGFKVAVKGDALSANMDISVKDGRQIIEIQFIKHYLIGLTLVLAKG
jgi:hypothetical protein